MGWIGVVTNEGKNLIANWNEGKVLKITSACAGTGTVETQALMAQTSLVSKVQDISIIGDATDNKSNVRTIKLQITAFQQSYLLNQVGLYASINDEASVLMAIYQTDEGIPIPSKEESPGFGYSFYAKLAVSNEGKIELNIDTSAYVTLESFLEHTNGNNAHTPAQVGAMGLVDIVDEEINNIVHSGDIYRFRNYHRTVNVPFEYAIIIISHNAPGGQMAHYAFANDGKIYKRFLVRGMPSSGGGASYYTDWEEIQFEIDTSTYVTLESFLEHTNGNNAHTPSQVGAMGYVTITDDEINNIVLSSNLYMYRSYEGTANTPFEYALILISHNAPEGQMAHYAFANDGKIYKRFLVREFASSGGGYHFTDWEEISSNQNYTIESVDLTTVTEITEDAGLSANVSPNQLESGSIASFKIDVTGYVELEITALTEDSDNSYAQITINGEDINISSHSPMKFSGYVNEPMVVYLSLQVLEFNKFTLTPSISEHFKALLIAHINDNDNPHSVTAQQVGMFDYVGDFATSVVDWEASDGGYLSPTKLKCSEGLEFEDIDNKTCALVGRGLCIDKNIVIPMYSSEGKMVTKIKQRAFEGDLGLNTLVVSKTVVSIGSYALDSSSLKTLVLTNPDVQTSARKTTAKLERIIYNGSLWAFNNSYLANQLVSENTKVFCSLFDVDSFYTKEEMDEALKNPSYEEPVTLTEITTAEGGSSYITDNMLSSDNSTFHIDIKGHIKFRCEVESNGGEAVVMGVSLGDNTGVYEYSFDGVVENGFEVYCSFIGVTFTEFVKKTYVKDAIGDVDRALDELHNYAQALIGGEA